MTCDGMATLAILEAPDGTRVTCRADEGALVWVLLLMSVWVWTRRGST